MKTNFFQQVAGLGFTGNFLLNIHQDDQGQQTVSVVIKKNKAIDGLPPMQFKATAEELDDAFFEKLAEPVKQTVGLISNLENYQKELDKARANAKPAKAKTTSTSSPIDEEEKEEENDLFNAQADDKQAKAEKKRLYEEAMEKVKSLAQQTKYAEALANLPDVAEYPDKAEAIEAKRQGLQAGKDAYDKLTASFND